MKILLLLFFYLTIPSLAIAQTPQIKVIAIGGDGINGILADFNVSKGLN